MASWLCRLSLTELLAGPEALSMGEASHVKAWVLCDLSFEALRRGPDHWLSFLPVGARFVLEVDPATSSETNNSVLFKYLAVWLFHPQVFQWCGKPLLFWNGLPVQIKEPEVHLFEVKKPEKDVNSNFPGVVERIPWTHRITALFCG